MRLLTVSLVTGRSGPLLGSEETPREWGNLSVEGSENDISLSHHWSERAPREGPQKRPTGAFYILPVPLRASSGTLFHGGRHLATLQIAPGETRLRDCEDSWAVEMHQPFQCIEFWISKAGLSELGYQEGHRRGSLGQGAEALAFDGIMLGLAAALLPSVRKPVEADALFLSSVLLAVRLHVLKSSGGRPAARRNGSPHLAKWQEVRAEDLISTSLASDLPIEQLAAACGLSTAHFARAFKNTTGLAPHQWRTRCRVEKVKDLLAKRTVSLSQIASECGFADQSHLTKTFSKATGLTPGAWRRVRAS